MNEINQPVKIEELIKLLKLLKFRPANGWGETTIIWKEGEIKQVRKREDFKLD